jgi:hypothetical protein
MYMSWASDAFTKWRALELPYDKVLFVDADMIFTENTDHLFDLSAPAACFADPYSRPYSPHGIPSHYKRFKHGDRVPSKDILKNLHSRCVTLNGGLVLLSPNAKDFERMLTILKEGEMASQGYGVSPGYGHKSTSVYDEQIIAELYATTGPNVWRSIDSRFNCFVGKDRVLGIKKVATYHYYNIKPLEMSRTEYSDLALWWSAVDAIVAKYPDLASVFAK